MTTTTVLLPATKTIMQSQQSQMSCVLCCEALGGLGRIAAPLGNCGDYVCPPCYTEKVVPEICVDQERTAEAKARMALAAHRREAEALEKRQTSENLDKTTSWIAAKDSEISIGRDILKVAVAPGLDAVKTAGAASLDLVIVLDDGPSMHTTGLVRVFCHLKASLQRALNRENMHSSNIRIAVVSPARPNAVFMALKDLSALDELVALTVVPPVKSTKRSMKDLIKTGADALLAADTTSECSGVLIITDGVGHLGDPDEVRDQFDRELASRFFVGEVGLNILSVGYHVPTFKMEKITHNRGVHVHVSQHDTSSTTKIEDKFIAVVGYLATNRCTFDIRIHVDGCKDGGPLRLFFGILTESTRAPVLVNLPVPVATTGTLTMNAFLGDLHLGTTKVTIVSTSDDESLCTSGRYRAAAAAVQRATPVDPKKRPWCNR